MFSMKKKMFSSKQLSPTLFQCWSAASSHCARSPLAVQSVERITRNSKFAMINRPLPLARIGTLLAQSVERARGRVCACRVRPMAVNKVRLDGRANFDSMVQSCLWHRSQFTRALFVMILGRTCSKRLMHQCKCASDFIVYPFIHFDFKSVNEVGDAWSKIANARFHAHLLPSETEK